MTLKGLPSTYNKDLQVRGWGGGDPQSGHAPSMCPTISRPGHKWMASSALWGRVPGPSPLRVPLGGQGSRV